MSSKTKEDVVVIYRPFITKKGKRIFRKDGGMWRLEIPASKYKE
jgi:hypothetical protein